MANLNKVLLIGRLTRDPESRSTSGGAAVVSFGLAVNRTYIRRDNNEKVEETCFVDVEAWGRTGETIHRYMKKGRQIFIEGRLKFDTWERDGQRRSKLSVVAETFQFLDGGNDGGDSGGGGDGHASRRSAPASVGARDMTPQDDYGDADDIPF
ncbi:MAG: single-stranded DNA-binding protein [Planctomycetota bacterium]